MGGGHPAAVVLQLGSADRDDDIVTMILLVHGGLWDDGMDADRFWHKPGVVSGLERRGFDVLAPDRMPRPPHWTAEADHLLATLRDRPTAAVVAGSNGCSAAVRLALARPDLVPRLLLAWPATAGDPEVDAADPSRARRTRRFRRHR